MLLLKGRDEASKAEGVRRCRVYKVNDMAIGTWGRRLKNKADYPRSMALEMLREERFDVVT